LVEYCPGPCIQCTWSSFCITHSSFKELSAAAAATDEPPTPATDGPPTPPATDEPPTPPATGDIPNMIELVRFREKAKRINIPQEIGTNYYQFGILLLEDETGTRIRSFECKYRGDSEQISTEILEQWINGKGKQPVTWGTLVEVLRDVELTTLAGDIEAVK